MEPHFTGFRGHEQVFQRKQGAGGRVLFDGDEYSTRAIRGNKIPTCIIKHQSWWNLKILAGVFLCGGQLSAILKSQLCWRTNSDSERQTDDAVDSLRGCCEEKKKGYKSKVPELLC